jgi:hypothetical protein
VGDDDRAAFADLIRGAMPDRVIANFVLVCEVLTEDGSELTVAHSDSITPWLSLGMLLSAQDLLQATIGGEDDDD